MTPFTQNLKRESLFPVLLSSLFITLIILLPAIFIGQYYQSRILPNTYLDQYNLGNYSFQEASKFLEEKVVNSEFNLMLNSELTNNASNSALSSSSAQLGLESNQNQILSNIINKQNQLNYFSLIKASLIRHGKEMRYQSNYNYEEGKLLDYINTFKSQIDQTGTPAAVSLVKSGAPETLKINSGKDSLELDTFATLDTLKKNISQEIWITPASILQTNHQLSPAQIDTLQQKALQLVGKKIIWQTKEIENFSQSTTDKELISCLSPLGDLNSSCLDSILEPLHIKIDRPATNPILSYNNGNLSVSEFKPPINGLTFNQESATQDLVNSYQTLISSDEKTVTNQLKITIKPPDKPLSQTNNLGINQRIGFGESKYGGSIAGRIHNITLASSKLNGLIIAPGEEFSFNKALGDVSGAAGYQPGYIIQGGRSVLSDGGGICQVSSTLFRALLDSGVKVTKRLPHSYRVGYYELNSDPGFDATVYSGNVDLRFINDTPAHILIYMNADSKNAYMTVQIYGTSDGRTTQVVDYKKYGATPAPATQFIPDSSLPTGAKKQIDWSSPGLKVSYTNIIRDSQGNEIRRDVYNSNYQAWSAKYLVGI